MTSHLLGAMPLFNEYWLTVNWTIKKTNLTDVWTKSKILSSSVFKKLICQILAVLSRGWWVLLLRDCVDSGMWTETHVNSTCNDSACSLEIVTSCSHMSSWIVTTKSSRIGLNPLNSVNLAWVSVQISLIKKHVYFCFDDTRVLKLSS